MVGQYIDRQRGAKTGLGVVVIEILETESFCKIQKVMKRSISPTLEKKTVAQPVMLKLFNSEEEPF